MEGNPAGGRSLADQQLGSGGKQSSGEPLEHGVWPVYPCLLLCLKPLSLFTVTWSLTNWGRLIWMLPSVGTKGQKASNLTADCWDASVHSSFLQKRLNFARAMSIICATLHCGTQHIKALVSDCGSGTESVLLTNPDSCLTWATLSERCLLEDNKHNFNSHRRWHNWKIRPLGSYILTGCYNCSPYILSIFTERSMHMEVAEKWGQLCNLATGLRQKKRIKSDLSLPYFLLYYSAGTLKCRDVKARRDHYNNFTWYSA